MWFERLGKSKIVSQVILAFLPSKQRKEDLEKRKISPQKCTMDGQKTEFFVIIDYGRCPKKVSSLLSLKKVSETFKIILPSL